MRFNLLFKFFIAFLATSLAIVVLMIVIMQFYAYRSFSDYVNKMEMLRLGELALLLSDEYRKDPGWNELRNNPERWRHLTRPRRHAPDAFTPPPVPPAPGSYLAPPPPPLLPDKPDNEAQRLSARDVMRNNGTRNPSPDEQGPEHRGDRERKPPRYNRRKDREQPPPFGIEHRLTLFDDKMQPVVGSAAAAKEVTLREITLDGKTVGWLGLTKGGRLTDPLDVAFLRQQYRAFYTTGVLMLLVAAAVAFLLSRHLLSPVQQLIQGTRALSARRFDTRIAVKSSDELGQLANDFNQMARTLERYEQMQRQWLSDIAHELRTPLAILQGEIEALQDGVREANRETLSSLHAESIRISKIVSDLHDLSLAESGALHFKKEPVRLLQTLRECLQKLQGRFRERGIAINDELGSSEKCMVTGDRDRLMQVFLNLLENTLRYTDAPGELTVRQRTTGGEVTVQFADTKPGVPPEAINRLCDRLYRVDASRSRVRGGSGLGLAICRTIVEAHGGTITLQHAASGGLQVNIVLPLGEKEQ